MGSLGCGEDGEVGWSHLLPVSGDHQRRMSCLSALAPRMLIAPVAATWLLRRPSGPSEVVRRASDCQPVMLVHQ
jgi:hypothetical protein